MKVLYAVLILFFTCLNNFANAQSPNWDWAEYARPTNNYDNYNASVYTNAITTDANGNSYITGSFTESISFGNIILNNSSAYNNYFIVKYDSSGKVIWAQCSGGLYGDAGQAIGTDAEGNCFVTGYFTDSVITFGNVILLSAGYLNKIANPNIFIVKYSPTGNVIWAKSYGGRRAKLFQV